MDVLKKQFRGSTLIEVIILMLIICVSFLLAFTLIVNLGKQSSHLKYRAYIYSHKELAETKLKHEYFDKNYKIGNIEIRKIIGQYKNIPNLYQLKIQAFDGQNKLLYDYSELLIIKRNFLNDRENR